MSEALRAAEVLAGEIASHHVPSRMAAERAVDYLDDGEKCVAALLAAVPEGPGVVILRGGTLRALEAMRALLCGCPGLTHDDGPCDCPPLYRLSRPPSPKGEQ